MASKRLGALPKVKRGAQGRGWGREGSGALPLARAAAVSTGLRVREAEMHHAPARVDEDVAVVPVLRREAVGCQAHAHAHATCDMQHMQ